jgi:hypothetical protein
MLNTAPPSLLAYLLGRTARRLGAGKELCRKEEALRATVLEGVENFDSRVN